MFVDWQSTGCVYDKVPKLTCIFPLFQNIVNAALIFSGATALIFVIWAGIQLVRSGGDAKQVEGARKTLTFALIGLVLVLMSFFILNMIAGLTGTECIKEFGFDTCN